MATKARSYAGLLVFCWATCLAALPPAAADTDVGNIAIIETDPTILQPGELFDLNGKTLTFTPRPGGGYTVNVGDLNFDSRLGANLSLGNDASVSHPLSFTFPFFGANYTSVFINSNGYVTLGGASFFIHFNGQSGGSVSTLGDASTVLDRIAEGFARVAVLWQDWNPAAGGGVFANSLADRLIVTWSAVPLFGTGTTATFQVVFFNTGVIQLNYQSVTSTPGGGYLVGISPGFLPSVELVTTIDFSQGSASSVSALPNMEPLVQVFGSTFEPLVHLSAVTRRFYRIHSDAFDQLVMFANFPNALGGAVAFEVRVKNDVSGIALPLSDFSSFAGSQGRLQSFLNMNRLAIYPDDLACLQNPTCRLPGNNDSITTLLGQESGHRWLAYVTFDDNGVCSDLLLGRDLAHWSFFHDTDASVMEGNSWVDNGDGTFTTDEDIMRYSVLDQYAMGLRTAPQVPPFFFIANPSGPFTRDSQPRTGVTVSGTRRNVTVNDVIACEGPRSPSNGFSTVNPTTTWKQGFILLIPGGTTASQADITKMDTIRAAWVSYFGQATGGQGAVDTTLPTPPALVAAVLPSSRSVQVGTPATAFATVINAGGTTATGVGITLSTAVPASFVFQTTDPRTNVVTGTANARVDIAPGAIQSFVIAITPTAAFAPTAVEFNFSGSNASPVPTIPGVNTLLLSASATPVPDIVALAATLANDGVVNIPGASGTGVFAVATFNAGTSGSITVTADTGSANLPVIISICQTHPPTGQCLTPLLSSVTTTIDANATPTFGIFVTGGGTVPFDPAANRIFVRFKDSGGVTRGSTSVAVRTQ